LQKRSPEPLKAVCQLLLTQVGRKQRLNRPGFPGGSNS